VKQIKKLPRAERVRLASSRFELVPRVVEAALDFMAEILNKRDWSSKLYGDKASRRQVRMLRDSTRKAIDIIRSDNLPRHMGALLASDMLGRLQKMHDFCGFVLSSKLTPKRDDADGFEKRAATWTAFYLLRNFRQPVTESDIRELTAILYGTTNAAAMRTSFNNFLKEFPGELARQREKRKKRLIELLGEIPGLN
jgi:hypothetical protein